MTKTRTTRDEETRDMHLSENFKFGNANPYDLPRGVFREGYSFHWGRTYVKGLIDNNLEHLMRKGWELVPASRTTGTSLAPLNRNPLSKEFICTYDTILMERPIDYRKREIKEEQRITEEKTRLLPGIGYTDLDTKRGFQSSKRYF